MQNVGAVASKGTPRISVVDPRNGAARTEANQRDRDARVSHLAQVCRFSAHTRVADYVNKGGTEDTKVSGSLYLVGV
jgi:hypothetical protein